MNDKPAFDGEKDTSFKAIRTAKIDCICIHEVCVVHDCSNEKIDPH